MSSTKCPGITIARCAENPPFPVSHHATIFRRQWLLENLKRAKSQRVHTPWQHERWCQGAVCERLFRTLYQLEDTDKIDLISVVTKGKLGKRGKDFLAARLHWEECKILEEQVRQKLNAEKAEGIDMEGLDLEAQVQLLSTLSRKQRTETLLRLSPNAAAQAIAIMPCQIQKETLKALPMKFEIRILAEMPTPMFYNEDGALCEMQTGCKVVGGRLAVDARA